MKKPEHEIVSHSDEFPVGLKTAAEICERDAILSEQRLLDLAESGYMPHYRIDGSIIKFKPSEVKRWIARNLLNQCHGRDLADAIRVVVPAPGVTDLPPPSIASIPYLQQLPKHGYQPGVYFLCKGDRVVYVGQSVQPHSRINSHIAGGHKDFDRVYLLPCPAYELDNVEHAFIHHLSPEQQGGIKEGRRPVSPRPSRDRSIVLGECYGEIAKEVV